MKSVYRKLNSDHQALFLAFIAYTLWTVGDTGMKFVMDYHLPVMEASCLINLASVTCLLIWCIATKTTSHLISRNIWASGYRGLFQTGVSICNLVTLSHLPLGLFYTIAFTAGFWIAFGSAVFFKEKISPLRIMLISIGFIGAVIAIDPFHLSSDHVQLIGCLSAICASLLFAAAQLTVKHASKTETPESLSFVSWSIVGVVTGLLSVTDLQAFPLIVLLPILVKAISSVTASFMMFKAMQRAHASTVASLHYTQIFLGCLFGYLIWHNIPTWNVGVGAGLITCTGLGMVYTTKKKSFNPELAIEQ